MHCTKIFTDCYLKRLISLLVTQRGVVYETADRISLWRLFSIDALFCCRDGRKAYFAQVRSIK